MSLLSEVLSMQCINAGKYSVNNWTMKRMSIKALFIYYIGEIATAGATAPIYRWQTKRILYQQQEKTVRKAYAICCPSILNFSIFFFSLLLYFNTVVVGVCRSLLFIIATKTQDKIKAVAAVVCLFIFFFRSIIFVLFQPSPHLPIHWFCCIFVVVVVARLFFCVRIQFGGDQRKGCALNEQYIRMYQ